LSLIFDGVVVGTQTTSVLYFRVWPIFRSIESLNSLPAHGEIRGDGPRRFDHPFNGTPLDLRAPWGPDKAIVIAGDDDHRIENNPGREKALAAAEAVAGVAIFPNFSAEQRSQGLTDFNDLAREKLEVVARQLEAAVNEARQGMTIRREHAPSMELAR
jgi:hypothetical protein